MIDKKRTLGNFKTSSQNTVFDGAESKIYGVQTQQQIRQVVFSENDLFLDIGNRMALTTEESRGGSSKQPNFGFYSARHL